MSRPENPLASYRSYSYHHILIVCDTDAAADWISDPDRGTSVFRSIGSAQQIPTEPQVVDDLDATTAETERLVPGNYVVILNELVDTSFRIRNASWFTATAASTDQQDRFNSIAVEGQIEVQEPRGVRFMNALNNAADLLQSDPTGLLFILKTIFVGHTDNPQDGSQSTTYITNIRPLRFMLYDVTGTFDTTGGTYLMSFAGASNGAARFPQFSRAAEQITLDAESTLNLTMQKLANQMTAQSERNRECLVEALVGLYGDDNLNDLRGVTYEIILEDPYTNAEYKVDRFDSRQSSEIGEDATPQLVFGKSSTVEQAIRHIMERSDRVIKDRTEGEGPNQTKYIYKIQSQITMPGVEGIQTENSPRNYGKVVVRYYVRRFAQVKNQTVESVLAGQDQSVDENEITKDIIQQNLIEFDYIFSGLNTDIINFDIKMEMGLAFLQLLATSNTLPTQVEEINRKIVKDNTTIAAGTEVLKGDANEDGDITIVRTRTPIFPATKVKDVLLRNAGNPKDSAIYQSYLSRHAALENLEVKLEIHGNPNLMNQTNRQANERARANIQADDGSAAELVMENWDTVPALAKINIFMPSTNDTPSTSEQFNRERFWYDGYYYIYGVEHRFSEGQFTQELDLLSLPNKSLIEEQNSEDFLELCGGQEKENESANNANEPTASTNTTSVPTAVEAQEASGRQNNKPFLPGTA